MIFEDRLALRFAPTYVSSANEDRYLVELEPRIIPKIALAYPPWNPCIYYSVYRHPSRSDQDLYEISYLSIWDMDTGGPLGVSPHVWDTERSAILVKGPLGSSDPSSFEAEDAYYARHGFMNIYDRPRVKDRGVTVYWSLGKHASYPTYPTIGLNLIDVVMQPENRASPPDYTLKNAGTLKNPGPSSPWINYKDGWGPDEVSSVYWKLKDPLWRPGPGYRELGRSRLETIKSQEQIKMIQSALDLPPSGVMDREFYARVSLMSPELIRNAELMDGDLFSEVVRRRPGKLTPQTLGGLLRKDVPLESVVGPKQVDGKVGGLERVEAVNLGQLDDETVIYGLILPGEKEIFDVKAASIGTIVGGRIRSSSLKSLAEVGRGSMAR